MNDFKNIKAFTFDIDGVMTDGGILADLEGQLYRTFDAKDGFAVRMASLNGFPVGVITGGRSQSIRARFSTNGINPEDIYLGSRNKIEDFEDFCKTLSHLGYVPGKFRLLQRNGDIGIAYLESVFFYESHHSGEQNLAVYSFEFVRIVRKVLPDVTQCQGAQTGIAQRVYGNISVRMGYKAILRVNFDTA